MGTTQSSPGSDPTKAGSRGEVAATDPRTLAQRSGLEEPFVARLLQALQGKSRFSKDEFLKDLGAATSGILCDEFLLDLVWGLESPEPVSAGLPINQRSLEEILVSFGVLSGDYPKKFAGSLAEMVLTSLGTRDSDDEDCEAEIAQEKVRQLFDVLFKVFSRAEAQEHSAHQLDYPFARPEKAPKSDIVLFRNSKKRPAWEVAKELDSTFPAWLDLISYHLAKEVFLSVAQVPSQLFPLLAAPPRTLSEESFFRLSLALGASKGGSAALWDRLYLASEDGFSMNRFETKTFKYAGPTLTLVRGEVASTEVVLAVYVEDAWQKSKVAWGGPSTRVFEVLPFFEAFVPSDKGLVCYNASCGIGIGPTAQAARLAPESYLLRVDASFQSAYYSAWSAYPERPTFKPSRFRSSPPPPFRSGEAAVLEILEIEVFGLGGKKALTRQKADWQFEANDVERRANLSAFKNPHDPANRQILEMAGIVSEDVSVHRAS